MKTSTTLVYAAFATLGVVVACSGDDSGKGSASTGSPTSTTDGSSSTSSGGTTTGTPTTTGSGGTGATTRACDNLDAESVDAETAAVPGSIATYSYGDAVSTRCLEAAGANHLCLYGVGADSDDGMGNMYGNWGAGLGVQLAEAEEDGTVIAPWDATALGITGVQFTLSGVTAAAPVRFGLGMVSTAEIPFQEQPFVNGSDTENDYVADGSYMVDFANLYLPTWTEYSDLCVEADDCAFDASRIHSMQFQLVTGPGAARPYDFCVSDITWLDATGAPVDVPIPMPMGEGGAGGEASM
jgi:hypothetical protein